MKPSAIKPAGITPRFRNGISVVLVVIAAMAIGRFLTDHLQGDDRLVAPFVRHGTLGQTVHLRYGDVRVTGIRVATRMHGAETVIPAGRFLIVDLAYRAKGDQRSFGGLELWDHRNRQYVAMSRGSTCPTGLSGATGVQMYAMVCFDVPRSALPGARFRFSLGNYGVNGSGQRRDDLAEIDLGIDRTQATRLWNQNLTYEANNSDMTRPLDTKPIKLKKPSWTS